MLRCRLRFSALALVLAPLSCGPLVTFACAQTIGSVGGTVTDTTGAAIPNAAVQLRNPVSGVSRSTVSDSAGQFRFTNIAPDPYRVSATSPGFGPATQDVIVSSALPATVNLQLTVAASNTTVNVEAPPDLTETDPTMHTDVDRATI